MRSVIVLQGCSGSGKSTYAQKLITAAKELGIQTAHIVSADDYFIEQGEYKFDQTKTGEAHAWCMRNFVGHISAQPEFGLVVVDNTNPGVIDIAPYMAVATAYGWKAEIHRILCDTEMAIARNVHGVPAPQVQKTADRIAGYTMPSFWPLTEVNSCDICPD
jgi:predicted kinase